MTQAFQDSSSSGSSGARLRIGVLGAGHFGSTLAQLFAEAHDVWLWDRDPDKAAAVESKATTASFEVVNSLTAVLSETDVLILAVTVAGTRPVLVQLAPDLLPHTILLNVSKGIELPELKRVSELVAELCPNNPYAILSGPCFASELAKGDPTAAVVASADAAVAERLMQALSMGSRLRLYAHHDVLGVELGGALKNIYAIGAGYLAGAQLGENALAAYITRSLAEMTRFAKILGAEESTLTGLSGLGDLMLTCHSPLSRNYQIGVRLAQGQSLVEVKKNVVGTAEGVPTCEAVMSLASRLKQDLPIVCAVSRLLNDAASSDGLSRVSSSELIASLMQRALKSECSV